MIEPRTQRLLSRTRSEGNGTWAATGHLSARARGSPGERGRIGSRVGVRADRLLHGTAAGADGAGTCQVGSQKREKPPRVSPGGLRIELLWRGDVRGPLGGSLHLRDRARIADANRKRGAGGVCGHATTKAAEGEGRAAGGACAALQARAIPLRALRFVPRVVPRKEARGGDPPVAERRHVDAGARMRVAFCRVVPIAKDKFHRGDTAEGSAVSLVRGAV